MEIDKERDKIVIKPKKKSTLKEMLAAINKNNLHKEVQTTGTVGGEIW